MNLKQKISELFGNSREPLSVGLEDLPQVFMNQKASEIEKARRRRENLEKKSYQIIEDIESSLEEIKGFEDSENLDIVEDVSKSFYNSRKNLLENLDLGESFEEHSVKFNEFVEDFNDVSMKEGAVLKRIHSQSGELGPAIQEASNHGDKLSEFRENGFKPVLKYREVKENVKNLEDLRKKIESLESDRSAIDTEEVEEKIDEKKEELQDLGEGEAMEEIRSLEEEEQFLKDKINERRSGIRSSISGIQRGLKKAIYEIENGDADFSGDLSKLERLREVDDVLDIPTDIQRELGRASEVVKGKDLLTGRQLEKFMESRRGLESLESQVSEIESLEDEKKSIEKEIQGFDVLDEKKSLEQEIEELKDKRDELVEEYEDLDERIEDLRKDLSDGVELLEGSMREELGRKVEIEY